jgi:hypothetical protein
MAVWRAYLLAIGVVGAQSGCVERACFHWTAAEGACPASFNAHEFFGECSDIKSVDSPGDYVSEGLCCYSISKTDGRLPRKCGTSGSSFSIVPPDGSFSSVIVAGSFSGDTFSGSGGFGGSTATNGAGGSGPSSGSGGSGECSSCGDAIAGASNEPLCPGNAEQAYDSLSACVCSDFCDDVCQDLCTSSGRVTPDCSRCVVQNCEFLYEICLVN